MMKVVRNFFYIWKVPNMQVEACGTHPVVSYAINK